MKDKIILHKKGHNDFFHHINIYHDKRQSNYVINKQICILYTFEYSDIFKDLMYYTTTI